MVINASNLPKISYSGKPINIKGNVAGISLDNEKLNSVKNINMPSNIGSEGIGEVTPNSNGEFVPSSPKSFTTDFIVIVTDVNVQQKILGGKYGTATYKYGRTPDSSTTVLYPQKNITISHVERIFSDNVLLSDNFYRVISEHFIIGFFDGVKISSVEMSIEPVNFVKQIVDGVIISSSESGTILVPPNNFSVNVVDGVNIKTLFFIPPITVGYVSGSGQNDFGALATNNTALSVGFIDGFDATLTPVSQWTKVYGGYHTSFAIKNDGSLWGSGYNTFGQLGVLDNLDRWVYVLVDGANTTNTLSCGSGFTARIINGDTLQTVGGNGAGSLGIGNFINKNSWQTIGAGYVDVSCGNSFTMALKTDNTVWVTGHGGSGVLGDGTFNISSVFKQVPGLYTKIYAGPGYCLAVSAIDGTLWGWGQNDVYQLDNTLVNLNVPIQISTETDWKRLSGGLNFIMCLKNNGERWGRGLTGRGVLGNNINGPAQQIFTNLDNVMPQFKNKWYDISCGWYHGSGRLFDGSMWNWGWNTSGQLANTPSAENSVPTPIDSLDFIVLKKQFGSFSNQYQASHMIVI